MDDDNFELKESSPIKLRPQFQPGMNEDAKNPKMVRWLINHSGGVIKNRKQANYILMGITVILFAITVWMIFGML